MNKFKGELKSKLEIGRETKNTILSIINTQTIFITILNKKINIIANESLEKAKSGSKGVM